MHIYQTNFMHFLKTQNRPVLQSRNNSINASNIKNNSIANPLTTRNKNAPIPIKPTTFLNGAINPSTTTNKQNSKNASMLFTNTSRNPINKMGSLISTKPIVAFMERPINIKQINPTKTEVRLKDTIKKQFTTTIKYNSKYKDKSQDANKKRISNSHNPQSPSLPSSKAKSSSIEPVKSNKNSFLKNDLISSKVYTTNKNPFSSASNYSHKSKNSSQERSIVSPRAVEQGIKKPFLSQQDVLMQHRNQLAEYEFKEILHYSELYYLGKYESKLHKLNPNLPNNGWDDDKGFYQLKSRDHLNYRYDVVSVLGNGSFGHVYQCVDMKTNEQVAVKILRNKEKFHKQGKIEVQILSALNQTSPSEAQFVVEMKDNFVFRNHICIVFEILSIHLFQLIQSYNYAVL